MAMPVLFIGHGSPMNIIEENAYTQQWQNLSREIPTPDSILVISAHWFTRDTRLMNSEKPSTIYDFYGFPDALYRIDYPSSGAVELAARARDMLGAEAVLDDRYGLDHGTWCVLHKMYPKADIPVTQLSVNASLSAEQCFALGQNLAALRNENVLILGSGNVVHNLRMVDFSNEGGYAWAQQFDDYICEQVLAGAYDRVIGYTRQGELAKKAVPTADHYNPLLYVLGAAGEKSKAAVYNRSCTLGSLSMTCYRLD